MPVYLFLIAYLLPFVYTIIANILSSVSVFILKNNCSYRD